MLTTIMNTNNAITPTVQPITSRICESKFGTLELTCINCTETEAKDGFIIKLLHHHEIITNTAFGTKVTPVKHTFYMKVIDPCEVGFKAKQDLDIFNIVERPFSFANEQAEQVEVWCKWLHVPTTTA